ncbi:MAG: VanW family protein [Clostridia bacterium]|nr:VanW family protein [Clostridia bacterium]
MLKRLLLVIICLCLALPFAAAETAEEPLPENVEMEGFAENDEEDVGEISEEPASIEGLTPLYTTRIKPFTSTGTAIRMREQQSSESGTVCSIKKNQEITIYKVYPAYVLAEYNGKVGYVIRTWIDEDVTTLDPENTPPYGTVPAQFVATLTEKAPIYKAPSTRAEVNPIKPNAGSKVAVLEFVDGFAKVLYWRSYGYIEASLLTDLVTVSPTEEPMSADTPIAAFCSFFEYKTGAEGNDGRCKNIVRSCESMTRVMQPGEQLDFNAQVGPYRRSNGYHPAPVLINGGSQLGYGGGTCQSSSTLYNTVRQLSGITILRRRPHGPGCARYLPMHQDAAVGTTDLNFIFRNDYDFPIRILAESNGEGTLCIQVFKGE